MQGQYGWADKLAGLTEEQKNVELCMLASTFPDDARTTLYDHPKWHYIDYAAGADMAMGKGGSNWLYQNRLWQGFILGIDIIKP